MNEEKGAYTLPVNELPVDYEQSGLVAVTVYVPVGREREIEHAALQLRHKDGVYLPNDLIY
jgi:hypothetical protein